MKSIAIVSAGLRFPGAKNLDAFKALLEQGLDMSRPVAEERWAARGRRAAKEEGFFHARAYRLESWHETAEGLRLSQEQIDSLDPLFHIGLGAAKDAFYSAKTQALDLTRAGVILGNIALPTETSSRMASAWLSESWGLGESPAAPASANLTPAALPGIVIAQALGLGGTTFTLDAACASTLYALKLACDELMEGRLDFVLAGGLSRPDPLYTQVGFTALDALSRQGRSYPLDGRADGLMVGEGAGIFGLKRLEDAERQGDRILAVVRGIGLSNDREAGLMAPSREGQVRAMRAAYHDAEWDARSVECVECHATGTALGDATEIQSLSEIRGGAPAVIGSVKSNVGHMLTAAGAAGVAKILLGFREKTYWPTANYQSSPESWDLERRGLKVLHKPEPWNTRQELRRAAISGFGFGGINAHLLLEEYNAEISERPVRIRPRKKVAVVRAADYAAQGDVGEFAIGYTEFRIPPKEMQEILPQQIAALMSLAALDPKAAFDKETMGCFVGVELDPLTSLYATRWQIQDSLPAADLSAYHPALGANQVMGSLASIAASRLSRELGLGGASFTVAAAEASGLRALELASRAIARGEMTSALVMAIDMGTSHRAKAQLAARYGGLWSQAADEAVALLLVEEQKARELGLPIAVILDDFAEFANELDLPFAEGPLWIEDIKRDAAWVQALPHSQKIVVDEHRYGGAAHGLKALLHIWGHQSHYPLRASFLLRDHTHHFVHWLQEQALDIRTPGASQGQSYKVARRDRILPGLSEVFGGLAAAPNSATATQPAAAAPAAAMSSSSGFLHTLVQSELATIAAHAEFLQFRSEGDALVAQLLNGSVSVPRREAAQPAPASPDQKPKAWRWVHAPLNPKPPLLDYAACTEFAEGLISKVFGEAFAEADTYPHRVRLPSERLLLCHRVMSITGEAKSLQNGKMTTEHDVFADAWYLEDGQMPTSIAVESGQADLMLSAYLGADFATKGQAVYRLLDARVSFHGALPRVGDTIRYNIEVKRFFEQNGTLFFNFAFEAFLGDRPLMSMVDGCAGFFSDAALAEGRGVKRSQLQLQGAAPKITGGFEPFVPMQRESYNDLQLDALRRGDYAACFGEAFAGLALRAPKTLPGGDMKLVHRILELEPRGGRFQCGRIVGEADIDPEAWFLTCHFVDDQVMPGTLMFECCLHTLRVYLMRAGWVGERDQQDFMPKPGLWSQLKCRGQVLPSTRKVTYEIEIKEIGYGPDAYVICDALMYADGKPIVDITDMSLHAPGFTKATFASIWSSRVAASKAPASQAPANSAAASKAPASQAPANSAVSVATSQAPLYTYDHILAFSNGKPSDCFGPVYRPFDHQRKIARLPRPPFQFLDSVETVDGPFMKQHVGTHLVAHYELPDDAWFWAANNDRLPFSVLVEIALQPCGFMAAYMGSALQSPRDLKFRNLSGEAVQSLDVRKGHGRLSIEVASTKIARSGDMIIQDYRFRVYSAAGDIYVGTTSFGFFTDEALASQAGIRGAAAWSERSIAQPYPAAKALPQDPLRMVDRWETDGSKIYGAKKVNPEEWFFEAHFFEDPVMPGSLGLESLLQVLEAEADRRWPEEKAWRVALGTRHNWMYRGQVRKHNQEVRLALDLAEPAVAPSGHGLTANGVLYCDGTAIYTLNDLSIEACSERE